MVDIIVPSDHPAILTADSAIPDEYGCTPSATDMLADFGVMLGIDAQFQVGEIPGESRCVRLSFNTRWHCSAHEWCPSTAHVVRRNVIMQLVETNTKDARQVAVRRLALAKQIKALTAEYRQSFEK